MMSDLNTQLTAEQVQQYHDEGFVVLGKILTDEQIAQLLAEEERVRNHSTQGEQADDAGARTLFFNQLCHFSRPVREVSVDGAHIPMVQQLLGPNVALEWNQFVTKFPDAGSGKSEFPWHQDDGYGTLKPLGTLTVWVALVDVDEQNGCIWVVPGSHKHGLLEHGQKEEGHWFKEVEVEGNGVPAVLNAGEALAFSGLTLHRSLLNETEEPRYGFFMRYCPPETVRVTADNQNVLEYGHAWMVAGEAPLSLKEKISS